MTKGLNLTYPQIITEIKMFTTTYVYCYKCSDQVHGAMLQILISVF